MVAAVVVSGRMPVVATVTPEVTSDVVSDAAVPESEEVTVAARAVAVVLVIESVVVALTEVVSASEAVDVGPVTAAKDAAVMLLSALQLFNVKKRGKKMN